LSYVLKSQMSNMNISKFNRANLKQYSEKEILESLYDEIRELAKASNYFESQYQSLQMHYLNLARDISS